MTQIPTDQPPTDANTNPTINTRTLGTPCLNTYEMDAKTEQGSRILLIAIMVFMGFAGIGLLIYTTYAVATGYRDPLGIVGGFGAGAMFAVLGYWLFTSVVLDPITPFDLLIELYPNGLLVTTNGVPRVVLWDDIDAFYEFHALRVIYGNQHLIYSARLMLTEAAAGSARRRDRTLYFPDTVANMPQLLDGLREHLTPVLYRRALAACEAGESASFGAWTVTRDGISAGNRNHIAWDDLRGVSLEHAKLTATGSHRRQSITVPLLEFANLYAFFALVAHYTDIQPQFGEMALIRTETIG